MSRESPIPRYRPASCCSAGPSGSGKSLLAARSGLPVLRLDDFYKEGDDPTLPLVAGSSDIDWDSPLSWDADAAVAAIAELCRDGPYDRPGVRHRHQRPYRRARRCDIERTPLFIAEGIFAAEIVGPLPGTGPAGGRAVPDAAARSTTFRRRLSCAICGRAASRCRSCCGAAGG